MILTTKENITIDLTGKNVNNNEVLTVVVYQNDHKLFMVQDAKGIVYRVKLNEYQAGTFRRWFNDIINLYRFGATGADERCNAITYRNPNDKRMPVLSVKNLTAS